METRRLKNIAILILLLLNIFLLLLLGYQHLQTRQGNSVAVEQLQQLFAADQISLSQQVDLSQSPLQSMSLVRDTEVEAAMAAYLLGNEVSSLSQGGGIYSYTTDSGSINFRSGGSFDSSDLALEVSDISSFTQDFFRAFDYVQTDSQISGTSGLVTAVQCIDGVPVTGCNITLMFDSGKLVAVSGSHISLTNAVSTSSEEQLSCITALVRFLDHRRDSGVVSRRVEDIFCIYELESSSSVLRLLPVWQIETDTYTYLVDCSDGEILRQS